MKKIKSAGLLSGSFFVLCALQSSASANQVTGGVTPPAACQDLVIVMKDDSGDLANPKKMTVFLDCHEAAQHAPSGTTMNFFIFDGSRPN